MKDAYYTINGQVAHVEGACILIKQFVQELSDLTRPHVEAMRDTARDEANDLTVSPNERATWKLILPIINRQLRRF